MTADFQMHVSLIKKKKLRVSYSVSSVFLLLCFLLEVEMDHKNINHIIEERKAR